MEKSGKPRKSGKAPITQKKLNYVLAWERFLELHRGAYPASIAAIKLGMTSSGVFQAAQRGHLTFFCVGRDRWYSRRDVVRYRDEICKRYAKKRPLLAPGENNFLDFNRSDES